MQVTDKTPQRANLGFCGAVLSSALLVSLSGESGLEYYEFYKKLLPTLSADEYESACRELADIFQV